MTPPVFPQSCFIRHHERFFFLYGKTDDEFCLLPPGILRLEEALHRHLKELGYRRILFFNGKNKLYCYDHDSKRLCSREGQRTPSTQTTPQPSPAPRRRKMCPGPLGMRKVRRTASPEARDPQPATAPPENEESLCFGRMNDLEMVGMMDHCMRDESVKTAVLFTDGLDFINHTEPGAIRQMAGNLNRWSSLFSDNENICIFLMPDLDAEGIRRLLERTPHWQFLLTRMFTRENQPSELMICIGPPRQDEVESLFHYYRLRNGLRTDWRAFPEAVISVTRNLCAKGDRLKSLSGALKSLTDLDAGTLAALSRGTHEEPAITRLRSMRGLEPVARKIEQFVALQSEREAESRIEKAETGSLFPLRLLRPAPRSERPLNLHLVLTGNPGTGKTTVANLLGEILRDAGLLELGHMVKASREDLVAGYVGQTALRAAEKISDAMGGVLFVDEAYRLSQGGENDFGREAVETIMEAMSNHMGEFSAIIAGYPERIEEFLETNPGLRRRFGPQNIIQIPDYEPPVLQHIFEQEVRENNRRLDLALAQLLPDFFINWHAARDPATFGNAGDVKNIFQEMDVLRAQRVHGMELDRESRNTFTPEDLPERLRKYLRPGERLEDILASLNLLIGLSRVKEMVRTMINRLKIEKMRKEDSRRLAPGHYLFVGNPGTGKTTVARKMGEMFRALGLLTKGHLVETGRSDLVAGYQGQTALKTRQVLETSLDGVLFIDEAYQLVEDDRDFFGKEALETLVAFMENHRDRLCIIAAGYPEPMRRFVHQNPGLPSRFTAEISFDNYNAQEMLEIFKLMAANDRMSLGQGVEDALLSIFGRMAQEAGPTFGNGREVRKLLDVMCARQANRLAERAESLDNSDRAELFRLEREDLPE